MNRGFSLVELMFVLVVIGVFAAVAIPNLIEKDRTNDLTDMTNMVQQTVAQTRNIALQNRRAAVMEYDGDSMIWVNTLEGSDCWSAIRQRCVHNLDADTVNADSTRFFDLKEQSYQESGVLMCDVQMSLVGATATCEAPAAVDPGSAFALCYSGKGELWVRGSSDSAAACTGSGDAAARDDWSKACAYFDDGAIAFDGALIRFNRFEPGTDEGACADGGVDDIRDVTRTVFVPSAGTPYSRVGM